MSSATSPTPSTSTTCPGSATNEGVHRSVTSRTRSPSECASVSTAPASVSMTTVVCAPSRGTMPVSSATVAAPIVPSPHET